MSQELHEGDFLRLLRRGHWEYVERTNSRGVVAIVAVTDVGNLILVEQYRYPVARCVVELPAGLVGDEEAGEALLEAARRELIEETGYAADTIEAVCTGPVTAGLSNEVTTFCVARGLERVGAGGGDDSEDITVHEVPLTEVDAWLADRPAEVAVDPKIHAGLRLLQAVARSTGSP
ncbi:MAG: NUDIX hydrolase [Gammaproteobacteria bacterium]|nr:NUDIX hydrolase [Gammaproteobacteria bacterium]